MSTPPDFGGSGLEEELPEFLGAPKEEHAAHHRDEESQAWESNEAGAAGKVCARCGRAIEAGQEARHRADGQWVHEICPI
jgi:hypothetical protein